MVGSLARCALGWGIVRHGRPYNCSVGRVGPSGVEGGERVKEMPAALWGRGIVQDGRRYSCRVGRAGPWQANSQMRTPGKGGDIRAGTDLALQDVADDFDFGALSGSGRCLYVLRVSQGAYPVQWLLL